MEMSPQSHLTYPMEQGHPPSDILCSTDISRKTMGRGGVWGGYGGGSPIVVVEVVMVVEVVVIVVVVEGVVPVVIVVVLTA